ncbi:MAG: H-NS histone family protein [Pseudomonadales bacterium]|nr:H-NS histone family protein [Pseudomonadales bacterium]
MSTSNISDIRKQLAALEKQEAKLLKKSRTSALKEIKALIKKSGITATDLASILPKAKRGRKPGYKGKKRGPKPKTKVPGVVVLTANGKRRGRPPKIKVAD